MRIKGIVVFVLALLIIGVMFYFKPLNYLYIAQINKNLSMGDIKLLAKEQDIKDTLVQKFTPEKGFGCRVYHNEKDGLMITFSGFPDSLSKYVLTGLEIGNAQYNVYGISVGDNLDKAEQILKRNGFREAENLAKNTYKKGVVIISLYAKDEAGIDKINIRLQSTNRLNVVF